MIEVKNLCKNFGDLEVIKDVSFTIEQGDIFGIIGQSGAGKSTLLRCFNGLEDYQSGSIVALGKEVKDLNKKELQYMQKDMGMIFQNFNLLNRLTVYDNIALPLRFWKQNPKDKENADRIHELFQYHRQRHAGLAARHRQLGDQPVYPVRRRQCIRAELVFRALDRPVDRADPAGPGHRLAGVDHPVAALLGLVPPQARGHRRQRHSRPSEPLHASSRG